MREHLQQEKKEGSGVFAGESDRFCARDNDDKGSESDRGGGSDSNQGGPGGGSDSNQGGPGGGSGYDRGGGSGAERGYPASREDEGFTERPEKSWEDPEKGWSR